MIHKNRLTANCSLNKNGYNEMVGELVVGELVVDCIDELPAVGIRSSEKQI